MLKQPITLGTGLIIGILAGVGIAQPLHAQVEDPSPIAPPGTDDSEVDVPTPSPGADDGEVGVPTPSPEATDAEDPIDSGNVALDQVILLNFNGQSRYYAPVNLDASQLEGLNVPTYNLGESGATADTTGGREPMVTYPPADSLEDLTPADILGEPAGE